MTKPCRQTILKGWRVTWPTSKWARAMEHLNKCNQDASDPACIWADVPRGEGNPPAPSR